MDDVLVVRRGEAVRDASRDLRGLARRHGPSRHALAQRLALEELGDEVRRAGVGAEVVDDEHVRVVERARRAGLLLEPAQPVGIRGHRRRQDLDRDQPPEPRVERAVELSHAAVGQRGHDLVRPELLPDAEAHGLFLTGT